VNKGSQDCRLDEFVRALEEARDYLEFSAEKAGYSENEDYLAVRSLMEQILKELDG